MKNQPPRAGQQAGRPADLLAGRPAGLPAFSPAGLLSALRQEVRQAGVLSFARFMELALYCPDSGYYERADRVKPRSRPSVGSTPVGHAALRGGDFYTSVSTGPLFGELLAFQFASWLEGIPASSMQLVEAGAHEGQLAHDILTWLQQHRPALFDRLEYWLVEPSYRRQEWQHKKLAGFAGRVRWAETLQALPESGINGVKPRGGQGDTNAPVGHAAIRGVIFSNELLDAFPVHRLAWNAKAREWLEWGVGLSEGRFVWQRLPDCGRDWNVELAQAGFEIPTELKALLPDGFILELCPGAGKWWREAAAALRRGKLLTIDYGFHAGQLLTPERSNGTLRAYHRHRLNADVLAMPGEQDLTTHVNFTALQRAGEEGGLKTEGLVSQAQFLTRIAETVWSAGATVSPNQVRQFQALTHPEHLGRSFKVFVQSRAG